MAHELCHLLVDRSLAFPLLEVLGGDVDLNSEKRANAFAAEVLLPQAHVKAIFHDSPDVDDCIERLIQSHKVSRKLAAWQIKNCSGLNLDVDSRIRLNAIVEKSY